MHSTATQLTDDLSRTAPGLQIGVDIVRISDIASSLDQFGDRFLKRVFTLGEIAYARSGTTMLERLSARFAAKEAALKALDLCHAGVNLRDIEVVRGDDGSCRLVLHGRAADLAGVLGPLQTSLSLSHHGDYAVAAVTVLSRQPGTDSFH